MCSKPSISVFLGECFGTFILVFFGCGASIISTVYHIGLGLFQIASIWGIALTLAIYASRHLSCAHFNPALSIAMFLAQRMKLKTLFVYIGAQLIGAGLAALLLLFLFNGSLHVFEAQNNIIRGDAFSIRTAMLLISYFPNPAMPVVAVSTLSAFVAEMIGTFFLILMILLITDNCNVGKPSFSLAPFYIGCLLAMLICIFAPLTQASFNPARDIGVRLVTLLFGWKNAAFNMNMAGTLLVYTAAPIIGGIAATTSFFKLIKPVMSLVRT